MKSQKGFSILEVLVASAVGIILVMTMANMHIKQLRENEYLSEQLASLSLQKSLVTILADNATCSSLFTAPAESGLTPNTAVFDSTTIPANSAFTLTKIPVNSTAGAPAAAEVGMPATVGALLISDITVNITGGTGPSYTADIVVSFNEPIGRPVKPIHNVVVLETTGTGASTQVTGCQGSAAPAGSPFKGEYTFVGQFTGTYNGTNPESYPVMVTAYDGRCLGCSGNAVNPCDLRILVGGVIISRNADNNDQTAKMCSVFAWVPAGGTYQLQSSPNAPSSGRYRVYMGK